MYGVLYVVPRGKRKRVVCVKKKREGEKEKRKWERQWGQTSGSQWRGKMRMRVISLKSQSCDTES